MWLILYAITPNLCCWLQYQLRFFAFPSAEECSLISYLMLKSAVRQTWSWLRASWGRAPCFSLHRTGSAGFAHHSSTTCTPTFSGQTWFCCHSNITNERVGLELALQGWLEGEGAWRLICWSICRAHVQSGWHQMRANKAKKQKTERACREGLKLAVDEKKGFPHTTHIAGILIFIHSNQQQTLILDPSGHLFDPFILSR